MMWVLALGAGAVLGSVGYWLRLRWIAGGVRRQAERIVQGAKIEGARLRREAELAAQEASLAARQAAEADVDAAQTTLRAQEKRIRDREARAESRLEELEARERALSERELEVRTEELEAQRVHDEARAELEAAQARLETVAGLSEDQARAALVEAVEGEARRQASAKVHRIEEEAAQEAENRAQSILAAAVQRLASAYVSEKTVSVVELSSDDVKGRIIGREGRNIRALEAATGVDVVIDDTPEVVVLSSFNPERRAVAVRALERLIEDGRIHPARIEEAVEQARQDLHDELLREGEKAVFELGLHGVHPELVHLLGGLKLRVVNGQNVWEHSVETAALAGLMAGELGLNAELAKRAGLFHDMGRAIDHQAEGTHPRAAADHARRFGEHDAVVDAIAHHHDPTPPTLLGMVVQAADILSKARPGVRSDQLGASVKRLGELERLSERFDGVERAWVMQTGREIRVMVDYGAVSDQEALLLSHEIARKVEETLTYPGEVKVMVIREARAVEIAR